MAKVIGVMGESGSGKTTAMRNLDPAVTFYIDSDRKGLNWRGWRSQYAVEKKNYYSTDSFTNVKRLLNKINSEEQFKHIKYVVIDTLNGMMVAEEMRILSMQSGDKRSAWSDLASNGWDIINIALKMRDDLTIIILCHSETVSDDNGIVHPISGDTGIFIYPGYKFKIVDSLITNFHLPESTLVMLVSAFAGRENVLNAYEQAVKERYRFFSFGDAMCIL